MLCLLVQHSYKAGPVGLGIFDIMRLIDHQHGQPHLPVDLTHDPSHSFIIRDCRAAAGLPCRKFLSEAVPMKQINGNRSEFLQFPAPVDQYACRADHKEMSLPVFRIELCHRGRGLYSLSQSHVVSEQNPLLVQDEFCPERLVSAQFTGKTAQVQLRIIDLRRQIRGYAAPRKSLRRRRPGTVFLQQDITDCRVFFKILLRFVSGQLLQLPVLPAEAVRAVKKRG